MRTSPTAAIDARASVFTPGAAGGRGWSGAVRGIDAVAVVASASVEVEVEVEVGVGVEVGVLVADATFRALLRLPADAAGASDALGRRAAGEPVLAAMLAQDGPERVVLAGADGAPPCELSRVACDGGTLLRATVSFEALPAPALEYAMLGVSLARLAGSVAHEVKNPLNAMALQ